MLATVLLIIRRNVKQLCIMEAKRSLGVSQWRSRLKDLQAIPHWFPCEMIGIFLAAIIENLLNSNIPVVFAKLPSTMPVLATLYIARSPNRLSHTFSD